MLATPRTHSDFCVLRPNKGFKRPGCVLISEVSLQSSQTLKPRSQELRRSGRLLLLNSQIMQGPD